MSTLPPGIPMSPPQPNAGFYHAEDQKRWSVVAIVGFVFSFLFVLAPIGILLGIVGIFRTAGGRRRGLGLAIAAIPVGLLVSAFTALMGFGMVIAFKAMAVGPRSIQFLEASRDSVPKLAAELYADSSKRFQLAVSEDAFKTWAVKVAQKHGTLQSFQRAKVAQTADGGFQIDLTGKFVNGPATIRVTIGFDGLHAEIDDIEVDGVSPIASATDVSDGSGP